MSQPVRRESSRLPIVDGWRAVAVLGVFWWHAWIHTQNPPVNLALGARVFNLQRWFVLLGNGVDFFFVLSGFCICLTLRKSAGEKFNAASYWRFIVHRWQRLSPAFYVVCLVTAGVLVAVGHPVSLRDLVAHLTWLFGVLPGVTRIASPFWSLQVEWEFYLLAPFVLLLPRLRERLAVMVVLVIASLAWRYHLHDNADGVSISGLWHVSMYAAAFVWGVVVAEYWILQDAGFQRLRGWPVFLIGFLIAFVGRGAMSTESFQSLGGAAGVLAKTISHPLMTLGFAIMLAATLNGVSGVGTFLSSEVMQWFGKHSYSMYLWHWWPCLWIGHALYARWGLSVGAHYATFAATTAISSLLSWLTYKYCEEPYFRHKRRRSAPVES